jgi:hypothetical protein
VIFVRDLLDTLRRREFEEAATRMSEGAAEFIVGQPRMSRSWVPIGSDLTLPQGVRDD